MRIRTLYKDAALIVFGTLLLLAAVEVSAAVALRLWGPEEEQREPEVQSYYESQDWGVDYLREARQIDDISYVPYVIWKTNPYDGQYIHVDANGNRTTPGTACVQNAYRVFMFGGSTMWGDGVPDWATIPAYVQKELGASAGRPLCIRNFGQPGWVSTQNVIELLRHLQTGDVPDLVIFYDGFNDVGVVWADSIGVAADHYESGEMKHRLGSRGIRGAWIDALVTTHSFVLMERLLPAVGGLRRWPDGLRAPKFDEAVMGASIVQAYFANHEAVRAMANAFAFEFAFFWQPSVLYRHKPLTPGEQRILDVEEAERTGMPGLLRAVYESVKAAAQPAKHQFFIADAFEDVPELVYLDGVHLTHVGNQKVATRIVETLNSSVLPASR